MMVYLSNEKQNKTKTRNQKKKKKGNALCYDSFDPFDANPDTPFPAYSPDFFQDRSRFLKLRELNDQGLQGREPRFVPERLWSVPAFERIGRHRRSRRGVRVEFEGVDRMRVGDGVGDVRGGEVVRSLDDERLQRA